VHEVAEPAQVGRVGLRKDAVAEVEDVARPAADGLEDAERLGLDTLERSQQQRRVEVPLDAAPVADLGPPALDRNSPVKTDDVAASGGKIGQ
jgi:hypothetical protein